jgi:predicted GIY-YIG superfamily endonuclease
MAVVYQHRDPELDIIFYVGIGKNKNRAYSKHSRGKFWRDYTSNKKWIVEIILENITWEEATKKEKELIKFYGRRDLGLGTLVNLTDGGDGVENPSEEVRKKNGDIHRGVIPWSKGLTKYTDKRVAILSEKLSKIKKSEEHRKKLSAAKKGIPNLLILGDLNPAKRPEVRKKISESKLGIPNLKMRGDINPTKRQEVRKKISESRKGKPGHLHSEKTKSIMREKAYLRHKIECEYCHRALFEYDYVKWHGPKCKLNK